MALKTNRTTEYSSTIVALQCTRLQKPSDSTGWWGSCVWVLFLVTIEKLPYESNNHLKQLERTNNFCWDVFLLFIILLSFLCLFFIWICFYVFIHLYCTLGHCYGILNARNCSSINGYLRLQAMVNSCRLACYLAWLIYLFTYSGKAGIWAVASVIHRTASTGSCSCLLGLNYSESLKFVLLLRVFSGIGSEWNYLTNYTTCCEHLELQVCWVKLYYFLTFCGLTLISR